MRRWPDQDKFLSTLKKWEWHQEEVTGEMGFERWKMLLQAEMEGGQAS